MSKFDIDVDAPILFGELIVNGYTVPLVSVMECDEDQAYVFLLFRGRLAYSVLRSEFWKTAEMVATAISLGLGLPCAPRAEDNGDPDERLKDQIDRIHIAMRPIRAMMVGNDKPDLHLVKPPNAR
jgi:hypothetical protein